MRPMTRWLLVALVLVAALFAAPKAHSLYLASLPLSDLAVRFDGEPRTVKLADGRTVEVVVHRKAKWCQCPGLGVIAQSPSANPDSLFQLTDALFRAFKSEAARETGYLRCLTVTLEVGDGMRGPWVERHVPSASLWRRSGDQKWVLFRTDWSTPRETRRLLRASWPREGTL
jgi:hypothetical protein